MGYVFLWIEVFAIYLLLVAAVLAVSKHRGPFWRAVMLFVVGGGPLALMALIAVGMAEVRLRYHVYSGPFQGMLLLTLCSGVGLAMCLWLGLRRVPPDRVRGLMRWSAYRLGLIWIVLVTLGMMTFWNIDLTMRTHLATAHAEAGALALSIAPPRVSDRDNAALIYQQAFNRMWTAEDDPPPNWLALTDQLNPVRATVEFDWNDRPVTELLNEHTQTLELLRQAAALPDCYFERDYGSPSVPMLVPELGRFRNGAQMLAIEARHALSQGDTQRAAENINAIFNMAEHVQREPILMVGLAAVSIEHLAVEVLQEALGDAEQNDALARAVEPQPMISYHRSIQRCFVMEEAFGLSIFSDFGSDSGRHLVHLLNPEQAAFFDTPGVGPLYRVFVLPDDLTGFRRVMRQSQQACTLPWWRAMPELQRVQHEFEATGQGMLTKMIFPALVTAVQYFEEADARHDMARLAVAMIRHLHENQRYPDDFDDLAPRYMTTVPNDPFTGKPFKRIRRDGALVLYSIGADLTDDGGEPIHRDPITLERIGDLVFRLPLETPRPAEP